MGTRQGVNKGTIECRRKMAAASQKDSKQLRSFVSWSNQRQQACGGSVHERLEGIGTKRHNRGTAMDMEGSGYQLYLKIFPY